jgi:hypothetical protein
MAAAVGELVQQAIAAHGGDQLWSGAREISARISSGGLAFASKFQGAAVRDVEARVATTGQRVSFSPYPREGRRGVLEADGSVRIETDDGEVLARRENPRARFSDVRHRLWWDRLDILYFGCYAIWTYVSAPFVFAREGYETRELEPWRESGEQWRRLAVRFPDDVHTHCRGQVFHIDAGGLIRRHDYTAEPIGGWARAAHYSFNHATFDGLVLPTQRRVFPRRRDGRSRSWPRLVWIDVTSASVIA